MTERIRPRAKDLLAMDDADDTMMQWPPAAKFVRKKAPQVGAAAAPPRTDAARPMSFAHAPDKKACAPRSCEARGDEVCEDAPCAPILGAVHERADTQTRAQTTARPTSRFKAQCAMDKDAGVDSNRNVSAFMRTRQQRNASPAPVPTPPTNMRAALHAHSPTGETPSWRTQPLDPTRDPGGGAPPEQMHEILRQAAQENEGKIAQMSYSTRDEELQDAASFFGADLLAKLRERRTAKEAHTDQAPPQGWPALERCAPQTITPKPLPGPQHVATEELESFRKHYFPDEPHAVNASLAWTVADDGGSSECARFDFHGDICWHPGGTGSDDRTFLAGLHHHGAQQSAPGYTVAELLHLIRSSVASQRTMALTVLGRICARFPMRLPGMHRCGTPLSTQHAPWASAALDIDAATPRAHILLNARWLLEDRHASVRTAALACLYRVLGSISVFLSDALGCVHAAKYPTAAEPVLDWLWLAQLEPEQAWKPGASPPLFHAQDAAYVELVRRDWASTLLQTNIVSILDQFAASYAQMDDAAHGVRRGADVTELRTQLVHIAFYLALHSADAARAIADAPHLLRLVTQLGGTAQVWPLTEDAAQWPLPQALVVLLRCIQSGREVTEAVLAQGALGGVLRYIVLPPIDDDAIDEARLLLFLALRILTALARYGQSSTSLREAWPALQTLGAWAADATHSFYPAAAAVFDMFSAWTVAALQRPRDGDLGANWPLVRSWIAFSAPRTAAVCTDDHMLPAVSAALRHVAIWARAASYLEPECIAHAAALDGQAWDVRGNAHALLGWVGQGMPMAVDALDHAYGERDAKAVHSGIQAIEAYADMAGALAMLRDATTWSWDLDTAALQCRLLSTPFLPAVRAPLFSLDGVASAAATQFLAGCTQGLLDASPALALPALIATAALGAPELVLVQAALQRVLEDAGVYRILMPFLHDTYHRVGTPLPLPYSFVQALQLPMPDAPAVPSLYAARLAPPDGEESDPMTGAGLWQSPAAGLPLRRDWPFAALDDLLHSADARVLNIGTLPNDWDFSEADIVEATLALAVRVMRVARMARAPNPWLPHTAHVWIGIYKVFLLEQNSSHAAQATGAATGKDLYRTEPIRGLLLQLMHLADQAATEPGKAPSLEDAEDALGTQLSFYQRYTDLVGLYDAVSLGDPVFARALIPPLAMCYACDYRRLLWGDYAHILRSIALPLHDAPRTPGGAFAGQDRLYAYLWPLECDAIVLARYIEALVAGHVSHAHQPLLAAIATHHLGGALWADESEAWHHGHAQPVQRDAVGHAVFAQCVPAPVQAILLEYAPPGVLVDLQAREAQRATWS